MNSQIVFEGCINQKFSQIFQLCVLLIRKPRQYWNAVIWLKSIGMRHIVNKCNIFETAVFENSQIFHIETLFNLKAVIPVKYSFDESIGWIEKIADYIGIMESRSRENVDFIVFGDSSQELLHKRSDIKADFSL